MAGMMHYGYRGLAILVSERGHYSLGKAADILGIGRRSLIAIETDARNKVRTDLLAKKCDELQAQGIKVMAMVGIAGASETGTVDPLDAIADIAEERGIHFHVDSAWGGPTLFSSNYRPLLKGIERADSVTLDAHKQLYVPMGAGICVFKRPDTLSNVEHHAEYIIRKGSKDLGSHTVEGSRPGMAILVHSGLHIIGRQGYELLIDQGINRARGFAQMIKAEPDFELISEPELNILTYRYLPADIQTALRDAPPSLRSEVNDQVNILTKRLQKIQRGLGRSFVSRTKLNPHQYGRDAVIVFRAVLANPLTTDTILQDMLAEQKEIAARPEIQSLLKQIRAMFCGC